MSKQKVKAVSKSASRTGDASAPSRRKDASAPSWKFRWNTLTLFLFLFFLTLLMAVLLKGLVTGSLG